MHRAHYHTSVTLIITRLPVIAAALLVDILLSWLQLVHDSPCCRLWDNKITNVGAQAILLVLEENTTLTSLKYDKYHVHI